MEIFLFYLSEYWLYSVILLFTAIGLIFLMRSSWYKDRTDKPQLFIATIIILYLIFFSGFIGASIKPYFTDHSKFRYQNYNHYGTGSFISSSIVMTNAHVVHPCKSDKIVVRDKEHLYRAEVMAVLPQGKGDIAFLLTAANKKNFVLFSADLPKIDDIVLFPNYTSTPGFFSKSKGKIIEISDREIRFEAPKGRKGNSGSPVFNTKGQLIALFWGGGGFFSSYSVATNAKAIAEFARQNKIPLFVVQNKNSNLIKDSFEEDVVTVMCAEK